MHWLRHNCRVQHAPGIFTHDGILSPKECEEWIAETERIGYAAAPITTAAGFVMAPDVRNNTRVIVDDLPRARALWDRVSSIVPAEREGWLAAGLNERFRFYRYDEGERFAPHYDGAFIRHANERSYLTFMIYLNDGFDGGSTTFSDWDVEIVPKAGTMLVFEHALLHTGEAVTRGRKYVLRSDVMYRASSPRDRGTRSSDP
jgi:predicted 2-oxoglutarate/Fe(II)-dependent dioxygenase YbiX